ncbi:MAG: DUF1178 family protein [Alphaproteobacteria bacterium]
MILYTLRCAHEHGFDAWFRNSATYDEQAAAGEVMCPVCGDTRVTKAPMAPRIASSRGREVSDEAQKMATMREMLRDMRAKVEANCEHVGDEFAEEARKMHYGEIEHRDIYGNASDDDYNALTEEGVPVARIPWLPPSDS